MSLSPCPAPFSSPTCNNFYYKEIGEMLTSSSSGETYITSSPKNLTDCKMIVYLSDNGFPIAWVGYVLKLNKCKYPDLNGNPYNGSFTFADQVNFVGGVGAALGGFIGNWSTIGWEGNDQGTWGTWGASLQNFNEYYIPAQIYLDPIGDGVIVEYIKLDGTLKIAHIKFVLTFPTAGGKNTTLGVVMSTISVLYVDILTELKGALTFPSLHSPSPSLSPANKENCISLLHLFPDHLLPCPTPPFSSPTCNDFYYQQIKEMILDSNDPNITLGRRDLTECQLVLYVKDTEYLLDLNTSTYLAANGTTFDGFPSGGSLVGGHRTKYEWLGGNSGVAWGINNDVGTWLGQIDLGWLAPVEQGGGGLDLGAYDRYYVPAQIYLNGDSNGVIVEYIEPNGMPRSKHINFRIIIPRLPTNTVGVVMVAITKLYGEIATELNNAGKFYYKDKCTPFILPCGPGNISGTCPPPKLCSYSGECKYLSCPCLTGTPFPTFSPTCFEHIDRQCSLQNGPKCGPCINQALEDKSICNAPISTISNDYCGCYGCCSPPRHFTYDKTGCECSSSNIVGNNCDIDLWNPSPYSSLYCDSQKCTSGIYSDSAPYKDVRECNYDCKKSRYSLLFFIIIVVLIMYIILFFIFKKHNTKKSINKKNDNI